LDLLLPIPWICSIVSVELAVDWAASPNRFTSRVPFYPGTRRKQMNPPNK
jgi:hypothetical protein